MRIHRQSYNGTYYAKVTDTEIPAVYIEWFEIFISVCMNVCSKYDTYPITPLTNPPKAQKIVHWYLDNKVTTAKEMIHSTEPKMTQVHPWLWVEGDGLYCKFNPFRYDVQLTYLLYTHAHLFGDQPTYATEMQKHFTTQITVNALIVNGKRFPLSTIKEINRGVDTSHPNCDPEFYPYSYELVLKNGTKQKFVTFSLQESMVLDTRLFNLMSIYYPYARSGPNAPRVYTRPCYDFPKNICSIHEFIDTNKHNEYVKLINAVMDEPSVDNITRAYVYLNPDALTPEEVCKKRKLPKHLLK